MHRREMLMDVRNDILTEDYFEFNKDGIRLVVDGEEYGNGIELSAWTPDNTCILHVSLVPGFGAMLHFAEANRHRNSCS